MCWIHALNCNGCMFFTALNEVVLNQKLQSEEELKKFWEDVLQLMRKAPPMSKLHDVACLNYNVKSELFPDNLEDAEKKVFYHRFINNRSIYLHYNSYSTLYNTFIFKVIIHSCADLENIL